MSGARGRLRAAVLRAKPGIRGCPCQAVGRRFQEPSSGAAGLAPPSRPPLTCSPRISLHASCPPWAGRFPARPRPAGADGDVTRCPRRPHTRYACPAGARSRVVPHSGARGPEGCTGRGWRRRIRPRVGARKAGGPGMQPTVCRLRPIRPFPSAVLENRWLATDYLLTSYILSFP